jgi:excisionase family DNA binding protein
MTNLKTGDPVDAKEFYSTAEAAKILGVSHRTIQLWVESGTLQAWKTAGGHRRITSTSVDKLLDARRQALDPDRAGQKPAAGAAQANAARQYKVVIADDDATLLRLYELEIGGWGLPLQLIKAGDGFDALLKIGEYHPDLLISDLSMPGMDGFRMVNSLRNNPKQRDLNIIIVSGLDRATISSLGLPADIPVYAKPVAFAQLRAAVEKTLAI